MNLRETNELLQEMVEGMLDADPNDLDSFGMDAMTQRRLKVKKLHKPKSAKKVRRPLKTHMPYHLQKV